MIKGSFQLFLDNLNNMEGFFVAQAFNLDKIHCHFTQITHKYSGFFFNIYQIYGTI